MKTELTNKRSTMGERSAETVIILNALGNTKPGDVLTYTDLGKLINMTDIRSARHILASAMRIALHEKYMWFGSIKNVGVQRLTEQGTVKTTRSRIKSHHNHTKKTIKILNTVDITKCDDQTRSDALKQKIVLGVLSLFSSNKHIQQLPQPETMKIDYTKTIEMFKK